MRAFAESIVEMVRHPLLVLDGELRIRATNSAFYRTFDAAPADTLQRFVHEVGGRRWDIPELRRLLEEILPRGGTFEDLEVRSDLAGVGRVMLLSGRGLRRDNGEPMILLAIEDVTERVAAREALERLNRGLEDRVRERTSQLEAANKELEAFCYSVSHDLRAPLRAMDGFGEELLRSYADRLDEKGRHYLNRLRNASRRMGDLIDDLLHLSRITRDGMNWGSVDLTELSRAVADDLRQREPQRQVAFVIEPGLRAAGDARLLRVAIENLLGNAWKFTAKRPSATIEIGRAPPSAGAPSDSPGSPAERMFVIRDDGAGFDMAHAGKLFRPFQRLHSEREFPGNGIGLATVQRVIHRHGGRVWAEGRPCGGAVFGFTLPGAQNS